MAFLWMLALGLTLAGTFLCLRRFESTPPHLDAPFNLIPVSILKPLKGADSGLERNLESFFRLAYPSFEILFSVARESDPAAPVVRALMARFPRVSARLIVGEVEAGINPKVNNLVRSYAAARNDWLLISDSNVRVEPAYLKRMVGHVSADTGMVTSVVAGTEPGGIGGKLEAVFLNTFYARGMCLADAFGKPCVVGKSMLFRRSDAERFGGIKSLGRYLAEDYMAGEAIRHLGKKVTIASDPVPQHIGAYRVGDFWSRHLRWGRIRKAQAPLAFIIEPWLGSIVSGLFGAEALAQPLGLSFAGFLALHLTIWSACDLAIMIRLGKTLSFYTPIAWFLRELAAVPLWLQIASGSSVQWRGQKLALDRGGLLRTKT